MRGPLGWFDISLKLSREHFEIPFYLVRCTPPRSLVEFGVCVYVCMSPDTG